MSVENVVMINDKEVKVSDLTEDQQYFYQQCLDLKNKQMKLKFDIDQVNASFTVFENALTKSYEEQEKETETKTLNSEAK